MYIYIYLRFKRYYVCWMASTAALRVSQSELGRPQISKEGYSENNQFLQVWRRERGEGRGERGEGRGERGEGRGERGEGRGER